MFRLWMYNSFIMATKLTLIKRRIADLVCDLLSEVNRLETDAKDCEMREYNTIMALIGEKQKTLEKLTKIFAEFK